VRLQSYQLFLNIAAFCQQRRLLENAVFIRVHVFQKFLHANAKVDALVAAAGLRQVRESRTFMWRVVLYERLGPA